MRTSALIAFAAALAALVLAGCGGGEPAAVGNDVAATQPAAAASNWAGAALSPPKSAADFRLTDQSGDRIGPSTYKGKAVLITFLYTHCPDVCPLIASNLNTALRRLDPAERDETRVIAVSVDPKGDTAKAVREYVRQRALLPQFRYTIGSKQELTKVWREYDVQAVRTDPDLVDHVAYTMLLNRDGDGIVIYDSGVKARQVVHDVKRVLAS